MMVKQLLKKQIKSVVGRVRCFAAGVKVNGKSIYIGKRVTLKGGKDLKLFSNVSIRPYCQIYASNIVIGEGSDIGERNRIAGNVHIGENVLIGPDNHISSETHAYEDVNVPIIYQGSYELHRNNHNELSIGEGSWIGTHTAIIGDVHIGKHCVVAANSVVNRDIPDYCVVGGAPAKVLKQYDFIAEKWIDMRK